MFMLYLTAQMLYEISVLFLLLASTVENDSYNKKYNCKFNASFYSQAWFTAEFDIESWVRA